MQRKTLLKIFVIICLIITLRIYLQLSLTEDVIDLEALSRDYHREKHDFITLPAGLTHYQSSGPSKGPSTILINDAFSTMSIWENTQAYLGKEGFHTLRYDLLGRGYSARVRSKYRLKDYTNQLQNLIEGLDLPPPYHLIGSGLGCLIAADLASNNREKVGKMIFISPAGFPFVESAVSYKTGTRLMDDLLFRISGKTRISEHYRKFYYDQDNWLKHQAYFTAQLNIAGSDEAILATLRHTPINNYSSGYRQLAQENIPILLIWGENDLTFAYNNHKLLKTYIPTIKFVGIKQAAHLPMTEQPNSTLPFAVAFLRQ